MMELSPVLAEISTTISPPQLDTFVLIARGSLKFLYIYEHTYTLSYIDLYRH